MKQVYAYKVILEDSVGVYRLIIPRENRKDAEQYVRGNGDIVAVKAMPEKRIDVYKLSADLKSTGWSNDDIDLVTRLIQRVGLDIER